MVEKYIDLNAEIISRENIASPKVRAGVGWALDYLDVHPDRAPGRTITAGEVGRRSHLINGRYIETPSIIDFLEALGITVVPDPEPTNAEKATADLKTWGLHRATALELGPWLAAQGWAKATGGGDD